MAHFIDQKLADMGIELPIAPTPAANYVPFVQVGNLVYVSGQFPTNEYGIVTGKLGLSMGTTEGVVAARLCTLALLAQLQKAIDDQWWRFKRTVKLTVFVNSTNDFTEQSAIANGASDLLVAIFGKKGEHVRSEVSAAALPMGAAVEIEGIFEIGTRTLDDISYI